MFIFTSTMIATQMELSQVWRYSTTVDTSNNNMIGDAIIPDGQCANWVPKEKRNVLFVHALGMKSFTSNTIPGYMSGEFYAAASWDYAIRQNGFEVEEVTMEELDSMPKENLEKYHRVVFACAYWHWEEKCNFPDDFDMLLSISAKLQDYRCKVGALYWWDHEKDEAPGFLGPGFFTPKQTLSPFDWQSTNTFLGMFPHFLVEDDFEPPNPERGRVGLVLGKEGSYFDAQAIEVVKELVRNNFTIHTTCRHGNCAAVRTIEGVMNHVKLGPAQYASLMKSCAFMLGIGKPFISPSPIIELAKE